MPIHDWARIAPAIFHHFRHSWIEEIKRVLNAGLLPDDHYALAERHPVRFHPDMLTLRGMADDNDSDDAAPQPPPPSGGVSVLVKPQLQVTAETEMEFYRRKQSTVAVRHVSGDRIVAMVEIVSPGNKASRNSLRAFVEKAADLLDKRIHLLILDLHPPRPRDPQGIHAAIWADITDQEYTHPADKPLTLAAYESGLTIRAYVIAVRVADALPDMPLFLEPEKAVMVPLEQTYQTAFAQVPRRWRRVLEAASPG